MRLLVQRIIDGAQQCLDMAKQRRNWGGIGEFYLDYSEWPQANAAQDFEALRQEIHNVFLEKEEPGIIIQFFPEDGRLRIGVIRTSENE